MKKIISYMYHLLHLKIPHQPTTHKHTHTYIYREEKIYKKAYKVK